MLIDLSHPLEEGRGAYPGLPPPRIGPILDHEASRDRYEGMAEFYLGRIEMATNTGTYLDAPLHRYRGGTDLAGVPLERTAELPGIVLDAPEEGPIEIGQIEVAGRAVLLRSGLDRHWPEEAYWARGPHLSTAAIDRLLGAALVGVDFRNVDDTGDPKRPAHTRLLEAGVVIVENLRGLDRLPADGFRFTAAPLAIVGGASFPVRAYAEV